MTGTISLRTFKQAVQGAGDDAALRLRQSDDSLTTAKRGLGGRILRFFNGGLDKADNARIAGQFLQGLQQKYGPEIAAAAFRMARPDARQTLGGDLHIKTDKPLTARQVRDALSYARAMGQAEQRKAATAVATLYAPENARMFGKVLADKNIDAGGLTGAHKAFYKERLQEQVLAATAENNGVPPKPEEVRRLAGKVLAYTASLDAGEIRDGARDWEKARGAGLALAGALGGSARDVAQALNDFLDRADARLGDATLGGASGSAGGDDIGKARFAALDAAVAAIPPHRAKAMYEAAMAPDGAGRAMLFALNAKLSDPKISGDMRGKVREDLHSFSAASESAGYLKSFLKVLGERGGIKGAGAAVDRVEDAGQSVKKSEFAAGARIDGARIQDAGIGSRGDVDKALRAATDLISQRKPVLAEREQEATERDREGMLREQEEERLQAQGEARRGSVSSVGDEGSSRQRIED